MGCSLGKHLREAEWRPGVLTLRVLPSVDTHKKFQFSRKRKKKDGRRFKKRNAGSCILFLETLSSCGWKTTLCKGTSWYSRKFRVSIDLLQDVSCWRRTSRVKTNMSHGIKMHLVKKTKPNACVTSESNTTVPLSSSMASYQYALMACLFYHIAWKQLARLAPLFVPKFCHLATKWPKYTRFWKEKNSKIIRFLQ